MNFCYRHPTHIARRRCYRCRRYICPKCQIRGEGHIFCSQKCLVEYSRGRKIKRIKDVVKNPLPTWMVRVLFYVGAIVIVIAVLMVVRDINYINRTGEYIEGKIINLKRELGYSSIEIIKPANGARVSSLMISVEGKAERCKTVGLVVNGELMGRVGTNSPMFYFRDVAVLKRENVIQAKCFSELGDIYSNAVVVYYTETSGNRDVFSYTQLAEDNLLRGNLYRKEIALTFDGGSSSNLAKDILSTLRKYSLKATFFLTGEFIENNPEIVREIVGEGHEVGNHTYSHPHLTTYAINSKQLTLDEVTKEFLHNELKKADEVFYKVTGERMSPFWRSPYGENNAEIRRWASEIGYTHVGWTSGKDETLDTLDWLTDASVAKYKNSEQIAQQILAFGKGSRYEANGGIILMHLGTDRKDDFPSRAIPIIINGYLNKGYCFVTISHMLNHKNDLQIAN